jgi:hypothetical protein
VFGADAEEEEFAHQYEHLDFYVVDSGFVVDLGVYSAPKQPHSPDQPRSFPIRDLTARIGTRGRMGIATRTKRHRCGDEEELPRGSKDLPG